MQRFSLLALAGVARNPSLSGRRPDLHGPREEGLLRLAMVVLVDGVGNGVLFPSEGDRLFIELGGRVFVKTYEQVDGKRVYRLQGTGQPVIRHINRRLSEAA